MKYLVMECRPAYAVVLSEDGEFRKVANLHYEVGQQVRDVVPLVLPEASTASRKKRWVSTLSAIAACLVLLVSSVFFGQMPCASVYMTINPEVRIDVNRKDMVVAVEGINADGVTLLEGYDHRKKDLDTVMDELVDRAIEMGYLHEGGKITLSLDGDEEWIVTHEEQLNIKLNEHLTDRITVTIDIEQPHTEQTQPTVSTETAVPEPVPEEYGDSDYEEVPDTDEIEPDSDEDEGDSGYEEPEEEESDYGESEDEDDDPDDSDDDED